MEPTKQDNHGKKDMISYQIINPEALQVFITNFQSSSKCQTTYKSTTTSLKSDYHLVF